MDEESTYFPRTYANAVARQQVTHHNPVCDNSDIGDLKPQHFVDLDTRNQKTLNSILNSNQQIQYTGMYTISSSALQSGDSNFMFIYNRISLFHNHFCVF